MIPVEELVAGDVVILPGDREVIVQTVDRYEARSFLDAVGAPPRIEYVVRWSRREARYPDGTEIAGGQLLGSLKPMKAGETVDARRPGGYSPGATAGGGQTRSRSRLADNSPPAAPTPRARAADPAASHAAARSVRDLADSHEAIRRLFRELGQMSDDVLVERYLAAVEEGLRPAQSPSGIRTRRHELADEGELVKVGEGRTRAGRACSVWALASVPLTEYDPEPPL